MQQGNEKKSSVSMEEIKRLAASPEAKQLLQLLQEKNPREIQKAAEDVGNGDYASAQALLSQLRQDDKAQALIRKLEQKT